jgi:hypothetical protein
LLKLHLLLLLVQICIGESPGQMSITNFFKRSVTEEEVPGKAGMEVPTAKKARLDDDVAAPPADGKNLAPLFGGKYGPV